MLAPGVDPVRARQHLLTLPGIGEWIASYVAMRALAWPDAFPHGMSAAITRYLDGDIGAIDHLPVRFNGTAFQTSCWQQLRKIPAGCTESYGGLARSIGKPNASRAVGLANGSNPIAIVVPCHRVIGADGSLTGYGGGMHRKQWLLQHEGALLI